MTNRIVFFVLCSVILTILGFYLAAAVEDTFFSPKGALIAWSIMCMFAICALYAAHVFSKDRYQFKAFGLLTVIATLVFTCMFGWIANGAWYNYYFFTDTITPTYTVQQSDKHPNQFLFKGKIREGAATALIRNILNNQSVDMDKPIVLEIHSDGGSPQEAMIMSEFIMHYNVQVEVVGKCISACTNVLLASELRYVHPRAWIGFHSVYLINIDETVSYDAPHLQFYNENLDKRLEQIGASVLFRKQVQIQDATGSFFPSYKVLKNEGIANQSIRLYQIDGKKPYYL